MNKTLSSIEKRRTLADWDVLAGLVEGELKWDEITRALYASSAAIVERWPDAVLTPANDYDVIEALRFCSRNNVPVTCRGAGSGVVGQSLGEGLIIDFSVHMNKILEVNSVEGWVRVEPGVVKDDLDVELGTYGFFWPPDPSSSPWCTVGAMVANNSGGAKSVRYGTARDYLMELEILTCEGDRATLRPIEIRSDGSLMLKADARFAERRLAEESYRIVREAREMLKAHEPEATRCSSGYNLFQLLPLAGAIPGDEGFDKYSPKPEHSPLPDANDAGAYKAGSPWIFDLPRLFCGSEGTLGVLLSAKLKIVPLPREVAGVSFSFESDELMAEGVVKLLADTTPAKLELLERSFIEVAAKAEPELAQEVPDKLKTLLICEYFGQDAGDCKRQVDEAIASLTASDGEPALSFQATPAYDTAELEKIWKIRKVASPILSRVKGDVRPTRWIEDMAVPPWKLPQFISGLKEILAKHGFSAALFGHAGEGNLHMNPPADVKDADSRERMQAAATEVFEMTRGLGGVISGEHGDGSMRAPYLRQMFGDAYDLMLEIKRIWDPYWVLNPYTKILPPQFENQRNITSDLRMGEGYQRHATGTRIDAPEILEEIEKCHGCGKCRTYCPLMRVGKEEKYSARAKANLLRAVVSGKIDSDFLLDEEFKANMDLCINCSQCLSDCPTKVDIPGMAIAFREQHLNRTGSKVLGDMLGKPDALGKLGTRFAGVTNSLLKNRFLRGLAQKTVDLDERRKLPAYKKEAGLPEKARLRIPEELKLPRQAVIFPGCWANYNDPDGERNALIRILQALGMDVLGPPLGCCGISKITQGDRAGATRDWTENLKTLLPLVDAGLPILFSAPSCLLSSTHDLPRLIKSDAARRVAEACEDVHAFLLKIFSNEEVRSQLLPVARDQSRMAYHMPCHSKVGGVGDLPRKLLALIPETQVDDLNAGCCGLSGTFGMKTDNFEASMKIGMKLFNRINTVNPDVVFTPCGVCQTQIMQGNPDRKILHPLKLLYDALPG